MRRRRTLFLIALMIAWLVVACNPSLDPKADQSFTPSLLSPPALTTCAPAETGQDCAKAVQVKPPPLIFSPSSPQPQSIDQAMIARKLEGLVQGRVAPGVAVTAGRGERVLTKQAAGRLTWDADSPEASPGRSVYDLASMTKPVLSVAVMMLVDEGKLRLEDPVGRYLPEFTHGAKSRVSVADLLGHTSGLPGYPGKLELEGLRPEAVRARMLAKPLISPPGRPSGYSNIGYVILREVATRAAREPVEAYLERRVFRPLGMRDTGFRPSPSRTAPTSPDHNPSGTLVGVPQDRLARSLEGYAGSAGLFSTARDMGRFAAMLASGGSLDGVRYLAPETLQRFTTPVGGRIWALGWRTNATPESEAGRAFSRAAFGHYGYTGTLMWIDPQTRSWTVVLSNGRYRWQVSDNRQKEEVFSLAHSLNAAAAAAASS